MNRFLITLAAVAIALALSVDARPEEKYPERLDNIDFDAILNNDRLFKKYLQCLLEDTDDHCPPDGLDLKQHIGEAMTTQCAKCTEKQKRISDKAATFMLEHRREAYKKIEAKYDPTGIFRSQYEHAHEKDHATETPLHPEYETEVFLDAENGSTPTPVTKSESSPVSQSS